MTDENTQEMEENVEQPDELSLLKERADLMGIKYHPNIGLDKLRDKVKAAQEGAPDPEAQAGPTGYEHEEQATIQEFEEVAAYKPSREEIAKAARKKNALRLVRVRVTNMNPVKANMKGDIYSTGNAEIGFIKKYVPFNAEQGWHVPNMLLNMLKQKKYVAHYEVKVGNKKVMKQKLVPELAIEVLPPLTPDEMNKLKQRQIMAQGGSTA